MPLTWKFRPLTAALVFLCLARGAPAVEVAPGELDAALRRLANETGLQILFDADELKGSTTAGVHGAATAEDALKQLLKGTRYTAIASGSGTYVVKAVPAIPPEKATEPPTANPAVSELPNVTVREKADKQSYVVPNASTATKTDTPILETPASVQVVSKQVIEDQNVNTLSAAMQNVGGIVATRNTLDNASGEYITIRGFSGQGAGANVLTDGSRFEGNHGLTNMADVESVEVLKGPAAILYGRMEPGGVVNVVTKKPLDRAQHTIEQQVGSWGTLRTRLDSTGPLDENKTLLYRVNLGYDDVESWREGRVFTKTTLIAPSLLWKMTPQTQIALDLKHNADRSGDDFQVTPLVNNEPGLIPFSRNLNEDSPSTNKNDSAALTLNHRFNSAWAIKAQFGHEENRYHLLDIQAAYLYQVGADWFADRSLNLVDSTMKRDHIGVDLTGNFEVAGIKHKLLFSADSSKTKANFEVAYDNGSAPSTINVLNPDHPGNPAASTLVIDPATAYFSDGRSKESGLTIQDQLELPHDIFVTASLRHQKYDTESVASGSFSGSFPRHDSATTPRLGVVWKVLPATSLYASYSEGYGLSSGTQFDGSPMPPTGAKQYEIGVKNEAMGGKLRSTLALFDLAKTNVATRDTVHCPPSGACAWSAPVGEQRSKGLEIDIQGEIQPNWSATFSYAYTDAKVTHNNTNPWQEGDRLPNVPRNTMSLWSTYAFTQDSLQGWKVGGGIAWRDAAVAQRFTNANPQQALTPGYTLVNAMTSYAFKTGQQCWTAQLNVNNLFNKKSWAISQEPFGGFAYVTYGDPRSVTASLKLDF